MTRTHPTRVIPIHWDSLTGPIGGRFTGPARAAARLAPGTDRLREFLIEKQRAHPELEFSMLPRFEPVVLFE